MSDPIPITSFRNFPVRHEFIELLLKLQNGEELKEYLMQVIPREEILSRPSPPSELDLNVLIIGIDSISNGHAQRKLPKSYNYIRDVLKGYIFMGHSVVGDGTTEQLAAFLTGKGEQEYKESRRGKPKAKPVDDWNWIFKKAKAHGYVTSYCEDMPKVGTFQYRLLGFQDPPTDFYPRPFLLAAHSATYSRRNPHCYGSEKIYNYNLDITRKFYEQYPERKKFLFHFPADLSHDDFNSVQLMDNDLLQLLTEFNRKGYLNNTLLIVLGDHGARFGDFRQTLQGKLEERLPFFSMTFPRWFKRKYPKVARDLKTNTQRLTSWFDVYATFNHLFEYPKKPESPKHAISLLTEIPLERSCKDANIPEHWCPCVHWSAVESQHDHLQKAALSAIDHINELNFKEHLGAKKCSRLSLYRLNRAEVEMPAAHVLRFRRSGRDGYEPQFSSSSIRAKDRCSYQISFVTLPSYGVFEASVHYVYGRFLVKGSISRINKYGDQPKCIEHLLPHLRKYCYCT
ncbi:uncharacterized protein LOC114527862 [Dendronephthya gigantea]|uniref:uncharacterized protein LOC114527862 n=1 Tax=Dendronephthya gigantea TaxID=151771 RepID=UPI00106DB654|nr:uncharacterized protein LOC114527862 [Dendronephthya gigantea]